MDEWITELNQLLTKPFEIDEQGRPEPHHVDLRESQFFDWETAEGDFDRALASFNADRARLAQELTLRYGAPEHRNIRPYFDGDGSPNDPGGTMLTYLTGWFFEVELWRAGTRGIVAQVGHYDKELPLELMLVVGDLSASHPTQP